MKYLSPCDKLFSGCEQRQSRAEVQRFGDCVHPDDRTHHPDDGDTRKDLLWIQVDHLPRRFHYFKSPLLSDISNPRDYNGKGKVVPVLLTENHAMKAYWESRGIAPRFLDLGTRWR
jgi:hypothetical protein